MDTEELKKRTKVFAHRCVKLAMALPDNELGRHIRGQLIRSSTSVASNYRAASVAQSKPTFIAKLSIAIEEADESVLWLEFAIDEDLMEKNRVGPLLKKGEEITAILVASRITARSER